MRNAHGKRIRRQSRSAHVGHLNLASVSVIALAAAGLSAPARADCTTSAGTLGAIPGGATVTCDADAPNPQSGTLVPVGSDVDFNFINGGDLDGGASPGILFNFGTDLHSVTLGPGSTIQTTGDSAISSSNTAATSVTLNDGTLIGGLDLRANNGTKPAAGNLIDLNGTSVINGNSIIRNNGAGGNTFNNSVYVDGNAVAANASGFTGGSHGLLIQSTGGSVYSNTVVLGHNNLPNAFATGSSLGIQTSASGNTHSNLVSLNGGRVSGGTYGIQMTGSGSIYSNSVTVDGGYVFGGTRSITLNGNGVVGGNSAALGNTITLNGDTSVRTGFVGLNIFSLAGGGLVRYNQITLNNTSEVYGGSYGAGIVSRFSDVSDNTVTLNDDSQIRSTNIGVNLNANNEGNYRNVVRMNSGSVSVSTTGIRALGVRTHDNLVQLNNDAYVSAANAIDIYGRNELIGNTVTLNGTSKVVATAASGSAVDFSSLSAVDSNNNVYLNDNSSIEALSAGGIGVRMNQLDGAHGVQVMAGASIMAGSGGTGVLGGGGVTTVTNAGLISASTSVNLGGGNDQLTLNTGSNLVGAADGGSNSDTVNLTGTGSEDESFLNFETLNVNASGNWTLSGNSAFTSGSNINSGALSVDGTLTTNAVVNTGGTIGGTGTVAGTVTALGGGKVAPGASIGTLSTGDLDLQSGSTLEIEVSDVAADQVAVNGSVVIDGATLNVLEDAAGFTGSGLTSFTIIDNDGADAVTGSGFGAITDNLALFDASVDLAGGDGNDVVLTLMQVAMAADFAQTQNQESMAGVLDELMMDPSLSPEVQDLVDQLSMLSAEDLQEALDTLSGEGYSNLAELSIADVESVMDILSTRFGNLFGGGVALGPGNITVAAADFRTLSQMTSPSLADVGPYAVNMDQGESAFLAAASGLSKTFTHSSGLAAWIEGYGVLGNLESGTVGVTDADYTVYGSSVGVDYTFDSGFLVGLSLSYAQSDVEVDGRGTETEGDTFRVAAYTGVRLGDGYIAGAVSYGVTNFEGERSVPILTATAHSEFDANDWTVYAEAGHAFRSNGGFVFEPAMSIRGTNVDIDGYTETGAAGANLTVESHDVFSLESSVGARFRQIFSSDGSVQFIPELRTFLHHEFADTERGVDAALGGASFSVIGIEAPATTASVGGGIGVLIGDRAALHVNYDAELASRLTEHTVAGSVRWGF